MRVGGALSAISEILIFKDVIFEGIVAAVHEDRCLRHFVDVQLSSTKSNSRRYEEIQCRWIEGICSQCSIADMCSNKKMTLGSRNLSNFCLSKVGKWCK